MDLQLKDNLTMGLLKVKSYISLVMDEFMREVYLMMLLMVKELYIYQMAQNMKVSLKEICIMDRGN